MKNPHDITKDLEQAICEYTGAPYCVAVNSCTNALLLSMVFAEISYASGYEGNIIIPKKTYCSVPMSIIHAYNIPEFEDREWSGYYQLKPLPIWDSARYFSSGMFDEIGDDHPFKMICVSFHTTKVLGDTQGGAILHSSEGADKILRQLRFDGRNEGVLPKDDKFRLGYHCYLSPDVAARLLWHMTVLPKHNDPLPNDDYPDLSKQEIFK